MKNINDGGPVFPCTWVNDSDVNAIAQNGEVVPPGGKVYLNGMSLRDHLAASMCLPSNWTGNDCHVLLGYKGPENHGNEWMRYYAKADAAYRYMLADAMLAVREKAK